jgi:hypothetical protein
MFESRFWLGAIPCTVVQQLVSVRFATRNAQDNMTVMHNERLPMHPARCFALPLAVCRRGTEVNCGELAW